MTKQELLAALRVATGPSRELDAEISAVCRCGPDFPWVYKWTGDWRVNTANQVVLMHDNGTCGPHFTPKKITASLDAANAFRERMLPGWGLMIVWDSDDQGVSLYAEDGSGDEWGGFVVKEKCATLCLSINAAVIAALIAQETQRDR